MSNKYPESAAQCHGRVRRFLKASGISQSEFARTTGYPRPHLCNWLNKGTVKYITSTTIDLFDRTVQEATRGVLLELSVNLSDDDTDALAGDTGLGIDGLAAFADGAWLDPEDATLLAEKLFAIPVVDG